MTPAGFIALAGCLLIGATLQGQPSADAPVFPATPAASDSRILGVIPNYQTVSDSGTVAPLTAKQKWNLAFQETIDPFNFATVAMGAGFSQDGNEAPRYGEGSAAFGKRFGAAMADVGTQNFFSAGLLATVLHDDPRYFRRGPGSKPLARIGYSISRVVIARKDSGAATFNAPGVVGMMMGIGMSNLYYPASSRNGTVMMARLGTGLMGGVTGNLMSEFWPDVQRMLQRKHLLSSRLIGKYEGD